MSQEQSEEALAIQLEKEFWERQRHYQQLPVVENINTLSELYEWFNKETDGGIYPDVFLRLLKTITHNEKLAKEAYTGIATDTPTFKDMCFMLLDNKFDVLNDNNKQETLIQIFYNHGSKVVHEFKLIDVMP